MNSILLIAMANIRRRALQSWLVGACLALAALLLSTTLGLLQGMQQPFDRFFDRMNASHLLLFFDHRQQDTERLIQWFQEQPEVASVSAGTPYFSLEEPMIFAGKEIDLMVHLTEHREENRVQDQVLIRRGEKKAHPDLGEIWIPNHLAAAHGIQIGDTLGIPTRQGLYPLIVSATVADPHYASSLFNPTRAWVAPGSLSFFLPISQLHQRMLGVRMTSPEATRAVWARFNKTQLFDGMALQYRLFKSVFLSFYQIISLVLLVFSGLAILAALFIVYTALSGAIAADYRLIGIYKAQGFTPGNVAAVYLAQYLALATASLLPGLLGSFWATRAMLASLNRSVGLTATDSMFWLPFSVTTGLLLGLVALLSYLGSRKAARVKPVEAIRMDAGVGAYSKRPFSGLLMRTRLSVPGFLGLRMLFANPARTIYTAFSLLIAVFILVFSVNIAHSFARLKDNKAAWGLEDSDLQVRLNKKIALPLKHEEFLELLQREESIATVVPYRYCSGIIPAQGNQAPQELVGKAYSAPLTDIGLENLEGRHPQAGHELSLCTGTAEQLGKRPGDSLELFIEGQRKQFLITGIYQDVSNLGQGFRLAGAAMKALDPLFEPELYAIRLKPGVPVERYKQYLQQTFAETVLPELSVEERKGIQSTIAGMRGSLLLISLFFLSILFIVLFNDTLMNIHEFRKSFGIFKTIGMTPFQIRIALVYKMLLLSAACLLFGIPLTLWLSPALIGNITAGIGLPEFPYRIEGVGTILVFPGMLLFSGLGVWQASKRVLKITPKELIAEA